MKKLLLGKLKTWENRLASYIAIINFIMIFYLYILETPFGLKWYQWFIIVVVGVVSIIYIDIKFIFPEVLEYTFKKNPVFMQLYDRIVSMEKRLDSMESKIDSIVEHLEKKEKK